MGKAARQLDWRSQKRQHGGSIKVIGDKIYARIQYKDNSGKRTEKLRRASSRKEARQLIRVMRMELSSFGSQTLQSDKLTFAKLVEHYKNVRLIPAVYSDGRKVAGKRSLGPSLSALKPLQNHFGKTLIRNIRPSDLEEYKIMRLATPVVIEVKVKKAAEQPGRKKYFYERVQVSRPRKIASVNRELQLLRAIFNFAKGEDLIIKTPFESGNKVISSTAEVGRDRVLSFDEETRLLNACIGKRAHLKPLIVTAIDTGARRGELFKLRWMDIDFDQRVLTIRATNAKTERTRIIGLTQRVINELQSLWIVSPRDLNCSVFGLSNTIKNSWKFVCAEAEIEGLTFHDLRHTATTRLILAGVTHSEVMKITGHAQIKTFLRYLNLSSENVVNSAQTLERFHIAQTNVIDGIEFTAAIN